jgi:hypothetical protein
LPALAIPAQTMGIKPATNKEAIATFILGSLSGNTLVLLAILAV